MSFQDTRGRAVPAVLAAAVLWGTTGTVAHQVPHGGSQTLVGLATFGFGGLVLLAVDLRGVARVLRDRTTWPRVIVGALGVIAYAGCYYVAMSLVGVAIGNVVALGSGPVFAALLELLIQHTRVNRAWQASTLASVSGIALLGVSAASDHTHRSAAPHPVLGVLLALASGLGYAVYSWAGAGLIGAGRPSRPVMATIFAIASVVLVPAFLLGHPDVLLHPRGVVVLAYLALVPMALAYVLFGHGLAHLSASRATTLALAEPIVATLLAATVLHEHLSAVGWCGLALVGVGIGVLAVAEKAQS